MSQHLDRGKFYGQIAGSFECAHARMSQVTHRCARCLPEHHHERAFFSMLVGGSYFEELDGRRLEYRPFDVGFHPAQRPHRDGVGKDGGYMLCLEIAPETLQSVHEKLNTTTTLLNGDISLLMTRAFRALIDGTLSDIIVESTVWNLLGALSRTTTAERHLPPWLHGSIELVRSEYASTLTVTDIARRVNVHPVHLSREFRRRLGQTLGEYTHKIRIRAACEALTATEDALADIGAGVGFADQSHFCRVFKSLVGCNPSTFRRGARRGDGRGRASTQRAAPWYSI